MIKTLQVTNARGDIVAEYPDFEPGSPVRVLPARDGSNVASADDGWEFAGATRHPSTAAIRDCHYNTTVHAERDRLLPR